MTDYIVIAVLESQLASQAPHDGSAVHVSPNGHFSQVPQDSSNFDPGMIPLPITTSTDGISGVRMLDYGQMPTDMPALASDQDRFSPIAFTSTTSLSSSLTSVPSIQMSGLTHADL